MRVLRALLLLLTISLTALVFGCSDDSGTNSGTDGTDPIRMAAEFADYDSLFEQIAPNAPAAASGSPSIDTTTDSVWWYGQYDLLDNVFGSEEPFSLNRNINEFVGMTEMIPAMVEMDSAYNFYLKHGDSVYMPEGGMWAPIDSIATLSELTTDPTVPTELQDLFGMTVDVDWLLVFDFTPWGGPLEHVAFKKTATTERIFSYMHEFKTDEEGTSFRLVNHTPADSSLSFKGSHYEDQTGGIWANWVYRIESENLGDFAYQMESHSNEAGDSALPTSVAAGGNKNTEFGIEMREYYLDGSRSYDTANVKQEVFTGDYNSGTSLITSFDQYLADSLFFDLSDLPTQLETSPFE